VVSSIAAQNEFQIVIFYLDYTFYYQIVRHIMAIVLASQSPRRQELLARIGVEDFKTLSLDIDESYPEGLSPEDTVRYIAKKKCDAAAALCAPDDLIITADTMVFLDNDRLGKPRDEEDALRMLRALSGRAHTVCTGVSVRRGAQEERFAVSTRVFFRPATDDEIRAYIKTGEPMDKAGAYGVQSRGALFVERIDGDFFNVMGLPVEQLGLVLARFGVKLL
jgi:septum formation protein